MPWFVDFFFAEALLCDRLEELSGGRREWMFLRKVTSGARYGFHKQGQAIASFQIGWLQRRGLARGGGVQGSNMNAPGSVVQYFLPRTSCENCV